VIHLIRFAIERSLLLTLLLLAAAATAEAAPDDQDRTLSPYFVVHSSDPSVEQFPLEHTDVDVQIASVIASVTVKQVYVNRGASPIHARYVFPASTRAAVSGMRMKIGDRVVEAQIREREEARREFEEARREGKSASLLEEERPNVFTMNLANVMPGDRVEVELRYTELIVPEEGIYELVLPAVVGPRYSEASASTASSRDRFAASPYLHEGEEPPSTFGLRGSLSTGIEIRELGSPTHPITIERRAPTLARFALPDRADRENDRDFILRYRLGGEALESGLSLFDAGDEKFFLLMAEPPARVTPEMIPPREIVFVVDVSGSMWGFPLDVTKVLMRRMAEGLRPEDRFNVLLFDADSTLLFPRSAPATRQNLDRALALLARNPGGGGTRLYEALERALSLPAERGMSRSFVVVTDGYISAERDVFDYVARHRADANVFVFGIGSSVNRFLVEGLARAGGGEPFVVHSSAAAGPAVDRFERYLSAPLLTRVKVRFQGFDAYDVEPLAVPDVLASRPIVVMGKYRGAAKGEVHIEGYGGRGKTTLTTDVSEARAGHENHALGLLWARTRVARIADYGIYGASEGEKREVTDLGLRYQLLTPFTSFIAVMKEIRNVDGRAVEVDQPLPLPMGVSDHAAGEDEYYGAPEPSLLVLLAALAMMALAFRRRREPVTR
jgi:Ca-activated chloride channel homolog